MAEAREGNVLPPTGDLPGRGRVGEYAERQCARVVGGVLGADNERICGLPPVVHIIWESTPEGVESGWACAQHAPEVAEKYKPLAVHSVGACCGMPGAVWSRDQNTCIYEGDIQTTEPVRAVAVEVPTHA